MRIAEGRARQYGVPFFSPINERGAHVMNCRRMMSVILSGVLSIFCLSTVAKEDREDRNDREARHQGEAIPALIQARQKFFGIENVDDKGRVDKDKVIFSWATNTTYVASVLGRVILLDSYINRPELPTAPLDKRRTPILPQDFVDVRSEEHTSELQSHVNLVCRLLLEKKK